MKILYFASIREQLGRDEESWTDLNGVKTVSDVIETLSKRGEPWDSVMNNPGLLIAVNQELSTFDTPISAGDELAFMPPVTGG